MVLSDHFRRGSSLQVIGHRGDSAHRPENTLASFSRALELRVPIIELDVQLTADRQVVVIHDATVDRTTNGKGDVRQMRLAEIRSLTAGYPERFGDAYHQERVPTLPEVLALLRGRARALIEIKGDSVSDAVEGGIEALTIDIIERAEMTGDVLLISFSRRALLRCRDLGPRIVRGALFSREEPETILRALREIDSVFALPEKGMLSERLLAMARSAGIRLSTWVVDDPQELAALRRYDLEAVASNRPGVLLEALARS